MVLYQKVIMYGELAMGHCSVISPALHFNAVGKKNLKLTGTDSGSCEQLADNSSDWHCVVQGER